MHRLADTGRADAVEALVEIVGGPDAWVRVEAKVERGDVAQLRGPAEGCSTHGAEVLGDLTDG